MNLAWSSLSPALRGALLVVLASVMFSGMGALAKLAGSRLNSIEVAFFRAFFGLVVILPFIWREGGGVLRSRHPWRLIARGVVGSIAMLCGFYAITHLSLAEATALSFTKPLFMVVLAALLLHETVRARRWSATVIGFVGVVVMVRPWTLGIEFAALVALASALCAAVVSILIKQLLMTETRGTILTYLGITSIVVTLPLAAPVWLWPTTLEYGLLIAMAVVGQSAQLVLMQGFRLADASALAPFDYVRLPVSALFGWLLFAEGLDSATLVGALIIIASTVYIARREANLRAAS